jgi:uncharacterized cofD-like protein
MLSAQGLKLVCIGGGHGLGRLLVALKDARENLTGIVATTDEGGSTGRLREEAETIAWGDLRNCLSHLNAAPTVGQKLFEYRFNTQGDLNGHNLGNLILFALNQMSVRPTDAIQVVRDMLRIESHVYPMSDQPTTLMADTRQTELGGGNTLMGELVIDDSDEIIDRLYLSPAVDAEPEVVESIKNADAIILSAGSFMTSIMPSLLVKNIANAINHSKAPLISIANLKEEVIGGRVLKFDDQLRLLKSAGIRDLDKVLWPSHRPNDVQAEVPIELCDVGAPGAALHDTEGLKQAILSVFE